MGEPGRENHVVFDTADPPSGICYNEFLKILSFFIFSISSIISYFMLKLCVRMFKNSYQDLKIENNFFLV